MKSAATEPAARRKAGFPWKWIALAAAGILLVILSRRLELKDHLQSTLEWIKELGPKGPIIFIGIYILATILLLPASILTLGAGIVFGLAKGALYVSIGATLGAAAAFLIGRHLARDWVEAKVQSNQQFRAIDEAVAREGWKIVGLTRLSPVFPFNLLNYGFGVTQVSFKHYFFASWIGMLPGTVMYVYFGWLLQDLAAVESGVRTPPAVKWIIGAVTVAVTIYITRLAKRALSAKVEAAPNEGAKETE